MKPLNILTFVLVVVGALNWGLVGFFNFDLVAALLGNATVFSRTVYALVGIAAIYQVANMKSVLS